MTLLLSASSEWIPEAASPAVTSPEPTPPTFMEWRELPSLVGSIRTRSLVARPTTVEQCRETLAYCREQGLEVCARGAGRGYGDVALNDGQVVVDLSGLDRILEFDEPAGRITVEGGARLIDIYREVHHRLLTLRASPTESHSTVAGAISVNVNGKDAWRFGSFADQVVSLTLLTAGGELLTVERSDELFEAVVGGIGMLGLIVQATLRLDPIPSPYMEIQRFAAPDAAALVERLATVEQSHDAIVVWVDAYARGSSTGRSVIHAARWIETEQSEDERRGALDEGYRRLENHRRFGLALHERFGPLLSLALQVQRPMIAVFNRLYYAMSRWAARKPGTLDTELFLRFAFEASFTVPPAHIVCGPRGYTVQLTFPRSAAREAIVELLGICQSSPCPPVTTILRSHRQDSCMLSFSEDGYSLNFEFHPKRRHERAGRAAVDRLVEATIRRGGKVHLAKDQVLRPEQFYGLYPRYEELLEIKRQLDPDDLFTSDLARRVGLARTLDVPVPETRASIAPGEATGAAR